MLGVDFKVNFFKSTTSWYLLQLLHKAHSDRAIIGPSFEDILYFLSPMDVMWQTLTALPYGVVNRPNNREKIPDF